MSKNKNDYVKKLCKKSIALSQLAITDGLPYDKAQELRKEQDKTYQKYMFVKKFIQVEKKEESKNDNMQR